MEMALVNAMSREFTLRTYLEDIERDYDYVLIDCMPSLGMITINALAAADSVIIPVQAHYLSAKGMTQLMKTISKVRKQINPHLKVEGILLTPEIPIGVKAAETTAAGKSIFAYDKNGKVAQAYAAFAKEVDSGGERTKAKPALSR
jgi:chromosome partitioning protein